MYSGEIVALLKLQFLAFLLKYFIFKGRCKTVFILKIDNSRFYSGLFFLNESYKIWSSQRKDQLQRQSSKIFLMFRMMVHYFIIVGRPSYFSYLFGRQVGQNCECVLLLIRQETFVSCCSSKLNCHLLAFIPVNMNVHVSFKLNAESIFLICESIPFNRSRLALTISVCSFVLQINVNLL